MRCPPLVFAVRLRSSLACEAPSPYTSLLTPIAPLYNSEVQISLSRQDSSGIATPGIQIISTLTPPIIPHLTSITWRTWQLEGSLEVMLEAVAAGAATRV